MTPYPKADVIYIGYPKAASTFVEYFLARHPQMTIDRHLLNPLYVSSIDDVQVASAAKPDAGKVHISINEKVAEGVCIIGKEQVWNDWRFVPDAWDKVRNDVILDQHEGALRLKRAHPSAKVLLVLRDPIDWLHSSYRFFMPRLPDRQRTFADFCATPRGVAYLQAGHFDQTITAYSDVFGRERVRVLRFEDIMRAPDRFAAELCNYLGIAERPMPQERENEGSTVQVARVRKLIPAIDRLPQSVKAIGKPIVSMLPKGRRTMLSDGEIRMLRSMYARSTDLTEKLVRQHAT